MAYKYTHYDHICESCGHKMEDGEDYIQNAWNEVYCIDCWEKGYVKEHEPWTAHKEQEETTKYNEDKDNKL